MKKILFIILFFSAGYLFSQDVKVLETSNDFTEIMRGFQKRVRDASREFKYFIHNESPFDFEDGEEGDLFDKKAKRTIGNKKYFIFEIYDDEMVSFLRSISFLLSVSQPLALSVVVSCTCYPRTSVCPASFPPTVLLPGAALPAGSFLPNFIGQGPFGLGSPVSVL